MATIRTKLSKKAAAAEAKAHRLAASRHRDTRLSLESLIAYYYARYGKDGVIEPRALMQPAGRTESLARFDRLNRLLADHPLDVQVKKKMKVRELLFVDLLIFLLVLGESEEHCAGHVLSDFGTDTCFEYMRLLRTGNREAARELAMELLKREIGGKTITDSIYGNKLKMSERLSQELERAIIRGASIEEVREIIRDRFEKTARKEFDRLIYTVDTFLMEEAAAAAMALDFEEYRYMSMEDERVCKDCHALHDKAFRLADRVIGINCPPMHPWCRCWIVPYVRDEESWIKNYMNRHDVSRAEAEKILKEATV